eukprot:SAG25_NODE_693_length_5908_cov_4.000344_8_plen_82_part_01
MPASNHFCGFVRLFGPRFLLASLRCLRGFVRLLYDPRFLLSKSASSFSAVQTEIQCQFRSARTGCVRASRLESEDLEEERPC